MLDPVREAIHTGQPAPAAHARLVAFHALRSSQLASPGLSDVRDGRLHLDGRIIPLAGLIRDRLTAWLAERALIPADRCACRVKPRRAIDGADKGICGRHGISRSEPRFKFPGSAR
jgi:hypothetical protein